MHEQFNLQADISDFSNIADRDWSDKYGAPMVPLSSFMDHFGHGLTGATLFMGLVEHESESCAHSTLSGISWLSCNPILSAGRIEGGSVVINTLDVFGKPVMHEFDQYDEGLWVRPMQENSKRHRGVWFEEEQTDHHIMWAIGNRNKQ